MVDRQTDPLRQFTVDGNGLVMTTRRLDRESQPSHRVHILAVDKGTRQHYYAVDNVKYKKA